MRESRAVGRRPVAVAVRRARIAVLVACSLAGCAPTIDGPVERQRAADRADADRLAQQLGQLPGAVRAEVTLHRPTLDPLSEVATPPSAAILVVVDDKADKRAIARAAAALLRGTAPEIPEPEIVVEVGAIRPVMAKVGPFSVDVRSKRALAGALGLAFGLVAALAIWIAWRERWRVGRTR
ncbi:MAG: hypothetical protein HOV81_33155 [Kofleriaceae bacterium]|nr:hypothetical protein [Kofleriaceae bacterium]